MVDLAFDDDERAFQVAVDELIRSSPHSPQGFFEGRGGVTRELYQRFGGQGWLSMSWPVEHGGQARPPTYEYLLWDTAAYHRAARPDLGPGIVAHVVIKHGDDNQRRRYLPGLASGSTCFALGYSEPEAGSDLAGLRTRAVRDGAVYRVSGEKCWTSDADVADHLWLLCRTGALEGRSRGLTLLVVALDSPGVTITPIETIAGHRLNQIFLDDVEVPAEDRIGAEGAAWAIVREALAVERHIQVLPGRLRRDLEDLLDLARCLDALERPDVRRVVADLAARVAQVEASSLHTVAERVAGRAAVVEAARTRLIGGRLAQDIPRSALELFGAEAIDADAPLAFLWRQSFMETIGGGTSEVILSIVAREQLALGARA